MERIHKWWNDRFAFVPFVGLCLILPGMHAAICTMLGGKMSYLEMVLIYCVASFLTVVFVCLPERWLWKAAVLLALVVGFLTGFFVWKNWELILEHAGTIASYINEKYFAYTGRNLLPEEWCVEGNLHHNMIITLLCILLGMYIAWAVLKLRSKLLMSMPVILLYCSALSLGVTPGQTATLLLVMGMAVEMLWISERQGSGNSVKHQIRTGDSGSIKRTGIAALILIVGLVMAWNLTSRISETVFQDVNRIQIRQHEMEQDLQFMVEQSGQRIRGLLGIDSGGYLSNAAPKYRNEKVFDVTLSGKPTTSVYLRGFVGDIYQNGKWKASKNIHHSNDKRNKGVWTGKYNGSNYTAFLQEQDMEIHYTKLGKRSKYLYLPYSEYGEMNEISRAERELCLGWQDDELPLYRDLADRIAKDSSWMTVDLIQSVQGILWGNAGYSLTLDPIPGNRDYAEHFLFYSQLGYCEHFATAGTLLLRHLNQEARYVSGYRISPDRFIKREDGTYIAGVLDSDAHAWSEVCVAGEYWMPQEMTPGIDDAEEVGRIQGMPEEDVVDLLENDQTAVPTNRPTIQPSEAPQETMDPETEEETEEKELPSESPGMGIAQVGNAKGTGSGSEVDVREILQKWWYELAKWQRVCLQVICVILLVLLAVIGIWRDRVRKRMRRMVQMRERNRSGYIRMRLGLFLDRLHRSGMAVSAAMPEGQWMQVLEKTLEDQFDAAEMEKAAELIRRAAYSREIVSDVEVDWFDEYCERTERYTKNR